MEHFDVLIIGAGLSGIGAARQLQEKSPKKTFAILEAREVIGGTWDLFRYPGIRSDSDMYTMGYDSKPWLEAKAIADGPSILAYVKEAAVERGLDERIRFGNRMKRAHWSSVDRFWTVESHKANGEIVEFSCNVLFVCSGYYNYEHGYIAKFEGIEDFSGQVVHPQKWPQDLDVSGKRVVIIGSGATAMTLVPALAKTAAKVTMLQRSPTYIVSLPAEDPIARVLNKLLPEKLAYRLIRWKNVQLQRFLYHQSRVRPEKVKQKLLSLVRKQLGDDFDVEKHFTPSYNPWDQRLCLVPDSDLFKALRTDKAAVVTDEIDKVVPNGIHLSSGETLDADIIVTATGLELEVLGGAQFQVDGEPVHFPDTYSYKGMMFSGVPNLIYTLGYINASWTLRSELVAEYVCRLVNHMDEHQVTQCTPRLRASDEGMASYQMIKDFSPGYMERGMHLFPKQGDKDPWRNTQNYTLDKQTIRTAPISDGVLEFTNAPTLPVANEVTTPESSSVKSAA
ncbi:MAG: NAD(P)/FAD-dependent oxidoreductase [Proteobacteria bacterium]|nr:NAD(P)/FAD-dependent oxidoreductase [Pseudomonadota bacterium]